MLAGGRLEGVVVVVVTVVAVVDVTGVEWELLWAYDFCKARNGKTLFRIHFFIFHLTL